MRAVQQEADKDINATAESMARRDYRLDHRHLESMPDMGSDLILISEQNDETNVLAS